MQELKPLQLMTLEEFEESFPDEEACCTYLIARRWPDGIRCPRCGSERVRAALNMEWKWKCLDCRRGGEYRFSHVAGTFFENTKAPLLTWFRVLHAVLRVQKLLLQEQAISALQVRRYLRLNGDCPYQTVWGLCHRLKGALQEPEFCALMDITPAQSGGSIGSRYHRADQNTAATAA
jgi:hypothetical protein